jgi:hypothetical protein
MSTNDADRENGHDRSTVEKRAAAAWASRRDRVLREHGIDPDAAATDDGAETPHPHSGGGSQ